MLSVLLVGLDNVGKSTLLAHGKALPPMTTMEIVPTMGFAIEHLNTGRGTRTVVYDCSGQARYRKMWDHFMNEADGFIYVIDASDKIRLSIVKDVIQDLVAHPQAKKKPITFLINKRDAEDTIPKEEIKRLLGLNKKNIPNKFAVKKADGHNGMGLNDALQFIETHKTKRIDIK